MSNAVIQQRFKLHILMLIGITILLLRCTPSYSQTNVDSLFGKIDLQKYANAIGGKSQKMQDALVKKSLKTLSSMEKQEQKIFKKLLKGKDSLAAKVSLEGVKEKYAAMKEKIKNPAIGEKAKSYIAKMDSLSTSLKFLDANGVGGKVKDALSKAEGLQSKFKQADEIKDFIKQRRELLKQQLEKLGMVKQLKQINKQVYYYSAQLKEYKEILKDPKKIEKKALELLSKTKVFKDFMSKNSMFASLFRMAPDNPNDPAYLASLAGLQTRSSVNNLIQQQIQSGGGNAQAQFQQQLQNAQAQLNQLKDKIIKGGGGSSDAEMPEGFKENEEKTRSFKMRLEFSANIQSQKATNFFPTTSDLGGSVGYKLNQKSIIGIGASYKLGLGRGWNNIRFTSEGMGLRSFIDWKIKGNLWVSGAYELNYKTAFQNFDVLRNMNAWQKSGLLGVSKILPIKSKFLKKTKVMLLWDFMARKQTPIGNQFVSRIGYTF